MIYVLLGLFIVTTICCIVLIYKVHRLEHRLSEVKEKTMRTDINLYNHVIKLYILNKDNA